MFTAFGFLWALAELFHLLAFPSWRQAVLGPPLFAVAVVLLCRPSSRFLLATMCLLDAAYVVSIQPASANHILFNGMVNLGIFWTLCRWSRRRNEPASDEATFREVRAILRIEVVLLYAVTAFHKLNADYFNADLVSYGGPVLKPVSSAGKMLFDLAREYPFLPVHPTAVTVVIWTTFLVELALPVLLLMPRTRRWGILLGILFHSVLALHQVTGIASFSVMMFASYFAFLPDGFLDRLKARLAAVPRPHFLLRAVGGRLGWTRRKAAFCRVLCAAAVAAAVLGLEPPTSHGSYLRGGLFLVSGLVLAPLFAATAFGPQLPARSLGAGLRAAWTPVLLIPLLILGHSMTSYLGLKTRLNLSMFSNLRTEGSRPNHFLMPASLKVFGYQDDLVELVETNHHRLGRYRKQGLLIPWFEFNRELHAIGTRYPMHRPLYVKYRRGGTEHVFEKPIGDDNSALEQIPWYLDKFLCFRPVDREGPMRSRW